MSITMKQIGAESVIDFQNPLNSRTIYWYKVPGVGFVALDKQGNLVKATLKDPSNNFGFLDVED